MPAGLGGLFLLAGYAYRRRKGKGAQPRPATDRDSTWPLGLAQRLLRGSVCFLGRNKQAQLDPEASHWMVATQLSLASAPYFQAYLISPQRSCLLPTGHQCKVVLW